MPISETHIDSAKFIDTKNDFASKLPLCALPGWMPAPEPQESSNSKILYGSHGIVFPRMKQQQWSLKPTQKKVPRIQSRQMSYSSGPQCLSLRNSDLATSKAQKGTGPVFWSETLTKTNVLETRKKHSTCQENGRRNSIYRYLTIDIPSYPIFWCGPSTGQIQSRPTMQPWTYPSLWKESSQWRFRLSSGII